MGAADIMTGIRQDFPIHSKAKKPEMVKAVRGLTWVTTDRGPMKSWLRFIQRSSDACCQCGETQNAVHLRRCKLVGDDKGRTLEQCQQDIKWCESVVDVINS